MAMGTLRVLGMALLFILAAWRPVTAGDIGGDYRGLTIWPGSETGNRMQLRELRLAARLHDGIAETTLTGVFRNDIPNNCQASLDLVVPPDSVVTGYAYWFQGKRIDARLVDNDRAWEIYRTVTNHGRDPAIMEQWGDERYHLQIYPVEPKKDLRVEVRYVSPWEGDQEGFLYSVPLFQGEQTPELETFDGTVRVEGLEMTRVSANLNTPEPEREGRALVYHLRLSNRQPDRNWEIHIRRPETRLVAYASGGRSGGQSGFGVLMLSPSHQLHNPRITIRGARVCDQYPRKASAVPAGGRVLCAFRYRRPGPATVTVRDGRRRLSTRVVLPGRAAPNSAATKFWAARHIKAMTNGGHVGHWQHSRTESRRQRERLVQTSMRFGVVSSYTAWLAIPKSELDFYKKVHAEELKQRQGQRVRTNAERVQGGDPLIRIESTEDLLRVTALLPTGEPIALQPQPRGVWEGRFDLPYETAAGTYRVTLVLERRDGTRHTLILTYTVDRTAPAGQVRVARQGGALTLSLEGDADSAYASLRFPNGEVQPFTRGEEGRFTATIDAQAMAGGADVVLNDRAHNVTVIHLLPEEER